MLMPSKQHELLFQYGVVHYLQADLSPQTSSPFEKNPVLPSCASKQKNMSLQHSLTAAVSHTLLTPCAHARLYFMFNSIQFQFNSNREKQVQE